MQSQGAAETGGPEIPDVSLADHPVQEAPWLCSCADATLHLRQCMPARERECVRGSVILPLQAAAPRREEYCGPQRKLGDRGGMSALGGSGLI